MDGTIRDGAILSGAIRTQKSDTSGVQRVHARPLRARQHRFVLCHVAHACVVALSQQGNFLPRLLQEGVVVPVFLLERLEERTPRAGGWVAQHQDELGLLRRRHELPHVERYAVVGQVTRRYLIRHCCCIGVSLALKCLGIALDSEPVLLPLGFTLQENEAKVGGGRKEREEDGGSE